MKLIYLQVQSLVAFDVKVFIVSVDLIKCLHIMIFNQASYLIYKVRKNVYSYLTFLFWHSSSSFKYKIKSMKIVINHNSFSLKDYFCSLMFFFSDQIFRCYTLIQSSYLVWCLLLQH